MTKERYETERKRLVGLADVANNTAARMRFQTRISDLDSKYAEQCQRKTTMTYAQHRAKREKLIKRMHRAPSVKLRDELFDEIRRLDAEWKKQEEERSNEQRAKGCH